MLSKTPMIECMIKRPLKKQVGALFDPLNYLKKKEYGILYLGIPFTLNSDIGHDYQTGGPSNISGFSNAGMDDLLNKGEMEADLVKRREIYGKVADIIQEDRSIFLNSQ